MAPVAYEVVDGVARITLDRAQKRNALDHDLRQELILALSRAQGDEGVSVLQIEGRGSAFCAGADLEELASAGAPELAAARRDYERILLGLYRSPKASLAVIDGAATGIGLALALSCDLRLASPRCRLVPGFVQVGLVPDGGLSWILPRMVGRARALELLLTGRELGAEEAAAWGLVNLVDEQPALGQRAQALSAALGASGTAVGAAKRALLHAADVGLEEAMEFEFLLQGVQLGRADFGRGLDRFRSRRGAPQDSQP